MTEIVSYPGPVAELASREPQANGRGLWNILQQRLQIRYGARLLRYVMTELQIEYAHRARPTGGDSYTRAVKGTGGKTVDQEVRGGAIWRRTH